MKTPVLLVAVCGIVLFVYGSDEFPLWGSTWVVAEGINPRIYNSVLPLRPKKVVVIRFDAYERDVEMQYANLQHRDYRSTAELIHDIMEQCDQNEVVVPEAYINDIDAPQCRIIMKKRDIVDTLWSCKHTFAQVVRERKNVLSLHQELHGETYTWLPHEVRTMEPAWHKEKPVAYVKVNRSQQDREDAYPYKDEVSGLWFRHRNADFSGAFVDHCDEEYCYERLDIRQQDVAVFTRSYWQLHIFPQAWYYPVDMYGNPMMIDTAKKTIQQADSLRRASIDDPSHLSLKYWRRPYLSDSASCIISIAFQDAADQEQNLVRRDYIPLRGSRVDSLGNVEAARMAYDHIPRRMYRVTPYSNSLLRCIEKLYTESEEEEQWAEDIDLNCGSAWMDIDEVVGRTIWDMDEHGVMTRREGVDASRFFYNGCPCAGISTINDRTAGELADAMNYRVPTCDVNDIRAALTLYRHAATHLPHYSFIPDKVVRLAQTKMRVAQIVLTRKERQLASYTPLQRARIQRRCDRTWVDEFRRRQ